MYHPGPPGAVSADWAIPGIWEGVLERSQRPKQAEVVVSPVIE